MSELAVGSIVRVIKQPSDMTSRIEGEVGFIDSYPTNSTHVGLTALKVDGEINGAGAVPLDCLALETAPHWVEAKRLYDEKREKFAKESQGVSSRITARIEEIAKKHGVTVGLAQSIYEDISKAYSRYGWPEDHA